MDQNHQIMTAFADKSIDSRSLKCRAGELLFATQYSPKDAPLTFQQMDKLYAAFKSKDTLSDCLAVVYSFLHMGSISHVLCEDLQSMPCSHTKYVTHVTYVTNVKYVLHVKCVKYVTYGSLHLSSFHRQFLHDTKECSVLIHRLKSSHISA